MFQNEEGWSGAFTRNQVEGALRNGTRIVKDKSEPGDATLDGTPGVVLGSLTHDGVICYFIEWAHSPRVAIGCMGNKVREADQ
jgi:hypothetical protein